MAVALNETISGLADLGTDLGAFLTNLTPGLVGFIAALAIVGAIVALIVGIVYVIRKKVKV